MRALAAHPLGGSEFFNTFATHKSYSIASPEREGGHPQATPLGAADGLSAVRLRLRSKRTTTVEKSRQAPPRNELGALPQARLQHDVNTCIHSGGSVRIVASIEEPTAIEALYYDFPTTAKPTLAPPLATALTARIGAFEFPIIRPRRGCVPIAWPATASGPRSPATLARPIRRWDKWQCRRSR